MKMLVPVDGSQAALAPLEHVARLARQGVRVEVLLINVQPRMHRHIARFTRRADREALRAERSRTAMAEAIERLGAAGVPLTAVSELGRPAERIAAAARAQAVDEIVMGTGRHPMWLRWLNPSIAERLIELTDIPVTVLARGRAGMLERYAIPAGVAGLAALLIAAD
ncbi:MAG: universal stress protein [Sphingomonadaceae bacterium]